MRNVMHMNFDWKYQRGFSEACIDGGFDDSDFSDVMIPHANTVLPYNNFSDALFQLNGKLIMEVATSMIMGEREAAVLKEAYVFTNCNYIRLSRNGACIGTYWPRRRGGQGQAR